MSQAMLVRQYIKDAMGQPVAIILPIEEYALVRPILEEQGRELRDKLHEMELAAQDPLFLADLRESMNAFEIADAEWWEHTT
jgi:hypothetical protein